MNPFDQFDAPSNTNPFDKFDKKSREKLPPSKSPNNKPGIVKTLFDQGMQGATFGFADEAMDAVGARYASWLTGEPYGDMLKNARDMSKTDLASQHEQRPWLSLGANLATGLSLGGGNVVLNGAQKLGGAVKNAGLLRKARAGIRKGYASVDDWLRTGNAATRAGKLAAVSSATGGAYGVGASDGGLYKRAGAGLKSALLSAAFGGSLPSASAVSSAVANRVRNVVVPHISPSVRPLAARAREMGVPLHANQVSRSKTRQAIQNTSRMMPWSGVDDFEAAQRGTWNNKLAQTLDLDDLSPESIQVFKKKNGAVFERLMGDRSINVDFKDVNKIATLASKVDDTLHLDARDARILKKKIKTIAQELTENNVTGSKLADIRSEMVEKSIGARGGTPILDDIVSSIDDIAHKNLTKEGAQELAKARQQYKYFKTVEPLLEKATDGAVNPTELLNRVKSNKYMKASSTPIGQDEFIDLARMGKEFMPIRTGSDTMPKMMYAGLGAGGTAAMINPALALQAGAGVLANRSMQKMFMNQNLIDKAIASGATTSMLPKAGLRSLLAGNSAITNTHQ